MQASQAASIIATLVPAGGRVSRLGSRGEKCCLPLPLFLEESPTNLCPFGTHSEISKQQMPQAVFKLLVVFLRPS